MEFDWNESLEYYKGLGAPGDQSAVIGLLKEVQQHLGGVPRWAITRAAEYYGVKESLFLALIRRVPSLRLEDTHVLEVCAGPNCSKRWDPVLKGLPGNVTVRRVMCMRNCAKGPNIRFDGKLYSGADEALIRELVKG